MKNFKIKIERGQGWVDKGEIIYGPDFDLNELKRIYLNISPVNKIPDEISEGFIFTMVKALAINLASGCNYKYTVIKKDIAHYVFE